MNVGVKLGGFALGLVAVFAAALGVGHLAGPTSAAAETGHDEHAKPGAAPAAMPGGLQVAQDGYRLDVLTRDLSTSDTSEFRFRIIGPDGMALTSYTTAHEKELHLIVVRRDLTGFQHVHPTRSPDGIWSARLAAPAPGAYRVFADFQPAGRAAGLVLGADVNAAGDYRPRGPMPASKTAIADGYQVSLDGELVAGATAKLTLTVTRDGAPVTDLQPYLGALGHLVVLRDGDLAYLHVHPEASSAAGPGIVMIAEVPSDGRYGLFLDFQHNGAVHTAQFTASTHGH